MGWLLPLRLAEAFGGKASGRGFSPFMCMTWHDYVLALFVLEVGGLVVHCTMMGHANDKKVV